MRKININEKNKELAIKIISENYLGKTYEQISQEYNLHKDFIYCLIKAYKPILGINGVLTKYDYLKINNKIKDIISDYESNISTIKIGEKYGVSDRTVASWLLKENIPIRDAGKISCINQNIFDDINTEIQAYVLGIITADGSVSKIGNSISICLTKSDEYLLELINEKLLDGLGNIAITHKEDEKPRSVLTFNGKHIKERLSDFGIVPNKSYCLKQLSNLVPEDLYHHYIRGLFDGDGVCSYYMDSHKKKKRKVRIGFCGHEKEFVRDYRDFLNNKLGLPKNKLFNTENCWQCSWSALSDIINFKKYIYQDATIFLGRKKKKIFDYVNTEVN